VDFEAWAGFTGGFTGRVYRSVYSHVHRAKPRKPPVGGGHMLVPFVPPTGQDHQRATFTTSTPSLSTNNASNQFLSSCLSFS
jgi:hypothetical protein